jgi:hypothetical protein
MNYNGKILKPTEIIEKILAEKDKTGYKASLEIGMNKNTVGRWKSGETQPKLEDFERFVVSNGYRIEITPQTRVYGRNW